MTYKERLQPKGTAVIKRWGPGISPNYNERGPAGYFQRENGRKIEPKETPSCLVPHLLVVFTQQLEILVTRPAKGLPFSGFTFIKREVGIS